VLAAKGIRTIFYIDKILILGPSYNIWLVNTLEALHLLINADFIIHWDTFLGFQWNTVRLWASPKRRWKPFILKPRSSPT
jgi:hypothetical protein